MSGIEQSPQQGEGHTFSIHPSLGSSRSCSNNRDASRGPSLASAFAVHRKVRRNRAYVSSKPVPRIFVVDDEHIISSTLAVIFNMNGFSARCFTEPLEALAAAQSDIPDLLISDVAMPGLSGVDLAIQMRALCPACKVLLFSGQAGTLDLLENARAQGHDFRLLLKPILPSELLAEIGILRGGAVTTETARTTHSLPSSPRVEGVHGSLGISSAAMTS
jgi:CheY-like chemotaxis protein